MARARVYTGVDHGGIEPAASTDTLAFIADRVGDTPAPTSCTTQVVPRAIAPAATRGAS